jgi:hypothetical protein
LTTLLQRRDRLAGREREVAEEAASRLWELGRDVAAVAFWAEFSATLSDNMSEEAIEGRRLAVKLRECIEGK